MSEEDTRKLAMQQWPRGTGVHYFNAVHIYMHSIEAA